MVFKMVDPTVPIKSEGISCVGKTILVIHMRYITTAAILRPTMHILKSFSKLIIIQIQNSKRIKYLPLKLKST